jgi:predicted transcriptional regulator
VHPTAATTLAPASSRSPAATPANAIEHFVGQRVAALGAILLEGLHERANGGLTPRTKTAGGDQLAALHGLRLFMLADWDFDGICRVHGAAALRAADISPGNADVLADEVVSLLHKIARVAAN